MKLSYFKDPLHTNFGDELNAWMWPKILPEFFDENDDIIFLGIGSIISDKQVDNTDYRADQKKIIFGSGFVPSYHKAPDVHKGDWDVLFVRGPRTAKALGVSSDLAIGDSAILLRELIDFKGKRTHTKIGFMPHWKSLERGQWEAVCEKAGITMIDPREPVEDVINTLLACDFIVTEAMHGAIVGDALRVPWIAATPLDPAHRGKWFDWAEALDIKLQSHALCPSSIDEIKILFRHHKLPRMTVGAIARTPLKGLINKLLIGIAAQRLKSLTKNSGSLSSEAAIQSATQQMVQKVADVRARYITHKAKTI